ncbi:DUF3828 domain-containing protein [Candidatus Parcubacteria bacterium]|jgi:hypothetical protein|nr:MAG: DUF3828 domain-containing protein [Candidatus Parcubacteria bacterium]
MKKTVIVGIAGIIILVVLIFLIASNAIITKPDALVSKFYNTWLEKKYMIADDSYKQTNMLSDSFKDKIKTIISSPEQKNYDPILCAQHFPKSFEIFPIKTGDTTAEIGVREYFDTIVKDIKISLVRKNAIWKIDDVICGDEPKQPEVIQFEEEGNIIERNGDWQLVYEKPGKPALLMSLDFSNWRCGDETDRCIPSFEQGRRVRVIGKKINEDTVLVDSVTEL